jgi:hypothetical protein
LAIVSRVLGQLHSDKILNNLAHCSNIGNIYEICRGICNLQKPR